MGTITTVSQVASQMKVGWNLGNTLEAICGETAWNGGVVTTQTLIEASGFNYLKKKFKSVDTVNKIWGFNYWGQAVND